MGYGQADEEDRRPVLQDVIEHIGMGWAQIRISLVGGCVWLADGAELLLIGTVTRALSEEWKLSAWERGSVVSVVFIGILMGNASSGPLGDHFGRRQPILFSYFGVLVFSIWSALTNSFWSLSLVRLMVGVSFGIGQPAFGALSSETTPAYWRIAMNGFYESLFTLGEVYSCLLLWFEDPYMQQLNWRRLLLLGAAPSAVLGVIAYFFLLPSPSYLAVSGDYDGTKKVLHAMARQNGVQLESAEFKPVKQAERSGMEKYLRPLSIVFSRRLLYSTLATCYSCFVMNCVFYGCIYAFPQVVTTVEMGPNPVMTLLLGALLELPGTVLGVVCGMLWPRKPTMLLGFVLTSLSLIAFGLGAAGGSSYDQLLLHSGYFGIKVFACIDFIIVYQYATEIYPTEARTTGTATCIAGGRLGGIVAPIIFEHLLEATGSFVTFFYVIAALCVVNMVLIAFLPVETFGKKLEDVHEPLISARKA